MAEVKLYLSYQGGSADANYLDIYDAARSLGGLSRALAMTTHAFLNEGDIRTRAERASGAQIQLYAPTKGSFQEIVNIAFSNPAVASIGTGVIGSAFWDFFKWTWSHAIGKAVEPATPHVRRFNERLEPFIGDISDALEGPLQELHRPIRTDRNIKLAINRPRVGKIVELNSQTLDYVTTHTESDLIDGLSVNITRYNLLSGFGRLFDDLEDRVISFNISDGLSDGERRLLTWSMDAWSLGGDGKILVDVRRILDARGNVRRYIVVRVKQVSRGDA